jgi:hypothetical protein
MRAKKLSMLLVCAMTVFCTMAQAGETKKGTIHVREVLRVGDKELSPGDYKVEWAGDGPDVELAFSKGKGDVVKVPAKVVPAERANARDEYGTVKGDDGKKSLKEISFAGKKYVLELKG